MSGLVTPWGTSVSSLNFANRLQDVIGKEVLGYSDDPEQDVSEKKGLVVNIKDKAIAVFREFEGFNVSCWMEDDQDVVFQFYPENRRAKFYEFEKFLRTVDNVFRRVCDGTCEATAEFYQYNNQKPHRVRLMHDRTRRGMDMVEIRAVNLYKVISWEAVMVDVLKLLQSEVRRYSEVES